MFNYNDTERLSAILDKLNQELSSVPDPMKRELNELWTRHNCRKLQIMSTLMVVAINREQTWDRQLYIEEFEEGHPTLELLYEQTKTKEYEIYRKYGKEGGTKCRVQNNV